MAEKDPKKIDEKAGTQAGTTQLTPEMTLFLASLTGTFETFQRNMTVAPPSTTTADQTAPKEFTGNAKLAVEKFNDILAGLQLKSPLTPGLDPLSQTGNTVTLTWRMPAQVDTLSGFKIQRAQLPTESFTDIATDLPRDKTSYPDGTVTSGTTYRYRVVALTTNRGEYVSNVQEIKIS
jgi:hypothetical protein